MSWKNFIPEAWSKTVLKDRDTKTIAVQNSWRAFQGDIASVGDRVHIQGIKGATIFTYDPTAKLGDPEVLEDDSMELIIDQKKSVNFGVKDIDKAQMNVQTMGMVQAKTANNLAIIQDQFVYGLAKNLTGIKTIDAYTAPIVKANALPYIAQLIAWLNTNNVDSSEVFLELHPYVYQKLTLALTLQMLPNQTTLTNGYRGDILGVHVYESNTIPFDDGSGGAIAVDSANAVFYNVIRTQEAIAFAEQKSMNYEAYRPQNDFMDAIKGYNLYGGKVVKPKEIAILKAKVDMTQA